MINSAENTAYSNNIASHRILSLSAGVNRQKSAPIRRFFICCLLWIATPAANAQTEAVDKAACNTNDYQEQVTVKQVIDGDTVILTDGRHIRLIGINTPEIGHDNRKSEMGADQARDFLSRLLNTNKNLLLHFDDDKTDHYGRTLAHLFLHDGTNIQSLLLKRGLATTFFIPPNIDFLECYHASVMYARAHHIGLWALKQYQPVSAETVYANVPGYHIVYGTVKRIGESESSIWINLAKNMAIRITSDDLQYFDRNLIMSLNGKRIIASGWVYFANGEFRMRIRHPVDMELMETPDSD